MSSQITQQLKATGVAQVIVVPKGGGPEGVAGLAAHFRRSDLSQNAALAAAGLDSVLLTLAGTRAVGRERELPAPEPVQFYPRLGVLFGTVDREGLAALRADPRVASVTGAPLLRPVWPHPVAAARLTRRATWGIESLGVPQLWREGLTGKGVRVAHLDTGADGSHPALKQAVVAFAEFDLLGGLVTTSAKPFDTHRHGTHTAATIAGRPVGGRHVGVAPGAELACAIVIEGGNLVARVLGGMDWALGQGVRVLNLSLGFPGYWEGFIPVTRTLRAKGVLPVIAAGNEGPGQTRSPGNYAEALSVGAVDERGRVWLRSSSQRFKRKRDPVVPDLVAPGVGVVSAVPGRGYHAMNGTSMAAPHVSGLAALLMEAAPEASVARVERAIFESCARPEGMDVDRGNRGVPDAPRALAAIKKEYG